MKWYKAGVLFGHILILFGLVSMVFSAPETGVAGLGETSPVSSAPEEQTSATVTITFPLDDADGSEFKPEIAVLACSEMPVSPHKALEVMRGDILIIQNIGNIVSLAGEKPDSVEIASLEYAVGKMGIRHILVVGHKGCGAVKSVIGDPRGTGHLPAIYQVISAAVTEAEKMAGVNADVLLDAAVDCNVKNSVARLKSDAFSLRDLVKDGSLHIEGMIYDPATGKAEPVK